MSWWPDWAQVELLATALLAIPAVYWSRRSTGHVKFSSLAALPSHGSSWRTAIEWLPDAMIGVAVVCLAVGAAGPRRGDDTSRVRRDGIAMVLAVDVSGSMRALDLGRGGAEQTRLDAVKQVFERFVLGDGEALRGRRDDAIGLVSFAGFADTRSPVTLDHGNLVVAARQLELVTERSEDGTAIGDGLALAVERLRQHPARSKVAIVLTDGVETAGTLPARSAIDLAVEHGIKVYAIGAGTNGVAPVRVETEMGSRLVQMPVEIDEALLREIAQRTGGEYFRATDGAGLERVYAAIDKLERSELVELQFTSFHEYYPYFVGAALILIALAFGLRGTVLRRLP
jgi:Ca-activated chloride channel family protein